MSYHEFDAELGNLLPDWSMHANDMLPPTMSPIEVDEGFEAAGQIQELPALQFNEPSEQSLFFDDQIFESERDNWPTPEAELTLEELLFLLTGRLDLQNVDSVTMHIKANMVSLSGLSSYLPRLAFLDLSGRKLRSLYDLGGNLLHLTHLNVSDCGLNTLDGTNGFPGLQVLIADANRVQIVDPLADLLLLNHLSVQYNRISDLATLVCLGLCPNLVQLELQGNPVTHSVLYRQTLQRCVSSLKCLDGEFICMVEPEVGEVMSISSAASSLSGYDDYSAVASAESLLPAESNLDLVLQYGVETDRKYPSVQPQPNRAYALPSATSNNRRLLFAESPSAGTMVDVIRRRFHSMSLGDAASNRFPSQQK